jgi:drug/metabolite transporter (DMT)-like permease
MDNNKNLYHKTRIFKQQNCRTLVFLAGAIMVVYFKQRGKLKGLTARQFIHIAGIGLLVMSLFFEDFRHIAWTHVSLGALVYLGVVASIGALGIFYWLIQQTNPTFPSTWTYAAPVIAMVVGAVFLGEKITWTSVSGAVCVLAGIIVLNLSTLRDLLSRTRQRNYEGVHGQIYRLEDVKK